MTKQTVVLAAALACIAYLVIASALLGILTLWCRPGDPGFETRAEKTKPLGRFLMKSIDIAIAIMVVLVLAQTFI
jgi:hypothetical protein